MKGSRAQAKPNGRRCRLEPEAKAEGKEPRLKPLSEAKAEQGGKAKRMKNPLGGSGSTVMFFKESEYREGKLKEISVSF